MPRDYETASKDTKSFDWTKLKPGHYNMVGNEIVSVDNSKTDCDRAADDFIAALRKLTT